MKQMSKEEVQAFLIAEPRTGKLATVRADCRPHVAPIWFDLDGEQLVFTTWHDTVKAANLRRDGRIALCVDDESPPFAYAIVEGRVLSMADNPDDMLHWATRIAGRYMGAALAESYGSRNAVPGELLVRVHIEKYLGQKEIAL